MTPAPCINHPGLDASAPCVNCGRPFCDACLVELLGARYCGPCRDQRLRTMQAHGGVGSNPGAEAIYAGTGTVDLGRWLTQGWNLISADLVTFAVASLLVGVVSLFSCFIAAGAMQAGMFMLVYRRMTYGRVEIGNLFEGFRRFANAFLVVLLIGVASWVLTQALSVPVQWLARVFSANTSNSAGSAAWLMAASGWSTVVRTLVSSAVYGASFFAVPHIAARNANAIDALRLSWAVFLRNPWMFMLTAFVLSLISTLGILAVCVGVLITVPLALAAQAQAYADHFGVEGWDTV